MSALWNKTKQKATSILPSSSSDSPLARRVEAQTLWPSTLEQESLQASLILRGFFLDGFSITTTTNTTSDSSSSSSPQKIPLSTIPKQILQNCKGLAILHILKPEFQPKDRMGGSGIVLAKHAEWGWSAPSSTLIKMGDDEEKKLAFPEGVDCMDVLCVINTFAGLKGFSDGRCRLGGDVSVAAGPMMSSGVEKADVRVYVKGKGRAIDVDLRGMVVEGWMEENKRFYREDGVTAKEILSGRVQMPAGKGGELLRMFGVIESGGEDYAGLPRGKSPGDCSVKKKQETFLGAWVAGAAGGAP